MEQEQKIFFDKAPDLQYAKLIFNTNTIAVMKLNKMLIPFMSENCRIVNISSTLAALNRHPEKTHSRFNNPQIKEEDILNAIREYLQET